MVDVAVGHANAPYVTAYPWSGGFGAKYSNPGTLPAGTTTGIDFSNLGDYIATCGSSSPYIRAYPWNIGGGFGTAYSNPSTLPPSLAREIDFSPSGGDVAVVHQSSPYVTAYPWSAGFGTKYSNPATLPAGTGSGVGFSPSGGDIVVAHNTTPYVTAYPWSAGFGTKYSNPATLPTGLGSSVAFSPSGGDVIIGHSTSPYVSAYPWSAGFGTKYSNPATLPAGQVLHISINSNDVVLAHVNTPYVTAYPWSAGFGTKYSNPATLPAGVARGVAFAPTSSDVVVAHDTTPYVTAYPWSGGFGTKYSDPATLPAGNGNSVAFLRVITFAAGAQVDIQFEGFAATQQAQFPAGTPVDIQFTGTVSTYMIVTPIDAGLPAEVTFEGQVDTFTAVFLAGSPTDVQFEGMVTIPTWPMDAGAQANILWEGFESTYLPQFASGAPADVNFEGQTGTFESRMLSGEPSVVEFEGTVSAFESIYNVSPDIVYSSFGVRLQVLDINGSPVGGPITNVLSVNYRDELDMIGSFSFSLPAYTPEAALCTARRRVQVYIKDEGYVFQVIITRTEVVVDSANQQILQVSGWSTARELVDLDIGQGFQLEDDSLVDAIDAILADSDWVSNSVDSLNLGVWSRQFNGVKLWNSLAKISEMFGVSFRADSRTRQIDAGVFGADSGLVFKNMEGQFTDNPVVYPLQNIKVLTDSQEIYTRVTPIGQKQGVSGDDITLKYSLPRIVGFGTAGEGVGNVTPGLPADYRDNDILLLMVESAGSPGATPAGWTLLTSVDNGSTVALEVFWLRASGVVSAPTVADRGDHTYAVIAAIRNCVTSGNPHEATNTGTEGSDDTVSMPSVTTLTPNAYVLNLLAWDWDSSSLPLKQNYPANAALKDLQLHRSLGTTQGNGGGITVISGRKQSAGSIGNTAADVLMAVSKAMITIAFKQRTIPYMVYSVDAPDGREEFYLQDDTAVSTYGVIKNTIQVKDIVPNGTSFDVSQVQASNALRAHAETWLARRSTPQVAYSFEPIGLRHIYQGSDLFKLGETIHLQYKGVAQGPNNSRTLYLDVDEDLYVIGYARSITNVGNAWSLKVSNVPKEVNTEASMLADIYSQLEASLTAPWPSVTFGGTPPAGRLTSDGLELQAPEGSGLIGADERSISWYYGEEFKTLMGRINAAFSPNWGLGEYGGMNIAVKQGVDGIITIGFYDFDTDTWKTSMELKQFDGGFTPIWALNHPTYGAVIYLEEDGTGFNLWRRDNLGNYVKI